MSIDHAHWTQFGTTYIDGQWRDGAGDEAIATTNPATEEVLAQLQASSGPQVEDAVAAARRAFDRGPLPRMAPAERGVLLRRIVEAIQRHEEELVGIVVDEVGSPVTLARALQVGGPIASLSWYAERAVSGPAGGWERGLPIHPKPTPTGGLLIREPVGVVAAFTAYNYPLNLLAWKLGGALATGCPVVVLPSPQGALSTVALFRVLEEADLPPGIVNLVLGGPEVGKQLSSHRGVDLVSFTGSERVGGAIMAQAAPNISRVVLELGGKSPNILLPGADTSREAILPSLLRFARNAGQGCAATTRILVHRSDLDDFVAAAGTLLESLHVGDPWNEDTVVGPLISAAHRDRVEGFMARAEDEGAKVVAGGGRPELPRGWYLNPALVAGLPNSAELCQEELFAPIACILPYDSVDEAVDVANDTRFGLNANVAGPVSQAVGVARRIRAGTVTINGGGGLRTDAPWGGYGASGLGRELGEEGLMEFLETKHIQWPLDGVGRPDGAK